VNTPALLGGGQQRMGYLLDTVWLLYTGQKCLRMWEHHWAGSRPHVDGPSPWLMKIGPAGGPRSSWSSGLTAGVRWPMAAATTLPALGTLAPPPLLKG